MISFGRIPFALLVFSLFLQRIRGTTTCYMAKPDPAGGKGGQLFDSGVNFSGVKSFNIVYGPGYSGPHYLKATIRRVFITFQDDGVFDDDMRNDLYQGQRLSASSSNGELSFNVGPDDPIVKVTVWTDGTLANAVQFQVKSGFVSQLYGAPPVEAQPHEFQGDQLVGVYGAFGDAMDSLGFSFISQCTQGSANGGTGRATCSGTEKSPGCLVAITAT
ncbi:expressed unknown protein [Seminavis robusta]|uniref:Jacalin-type lectin domain-containing protein n=1 Tax=Seminavis robusta TaxID=568900 RepID=A0A9N8DDL9_9STRA|nr:expressed unknown protein [Seminavis robusta]|eukprot:Sro45_g027020.1 n/a (217) ;mRNA; f:95013-95663